MWLLMQGTKVLEHPRGYLRKKTGPQVGAFAKGKTQTKQHHTTSQRQPEEPAQPDERQPKAGTAEHDKRLEMWPDIPPTWELERGARGHWET